MSEKLLTIGIPTFNRKESLELCLKALMPQVKLHSEKIRVIVSDNASEVDNYEIINQYNQEGYEIGYFRHSENLGMDGNFISIFESTTTKYMWQLSDDDILVENGLSKVMHILEMEEECGVLYLNNIWFSDKVNYSHFHTNKDINYQKYDNPIDYLKRVNYWTTFLSANIVNKEKLSIEKLINEFQGTYLALLAWNIPACFQNLPNYVLETPILACRAKGQGGFKFVEVFAVNFNSILDRLIKLGYPKKIKSIINYNLLKFFFPHFVLAQKDHITKASTNYLKENYFWRLLRVFYKNSFFYIYLLPAFLLSKRFYLFYNSRVKRFI